MPLEDFFTLTEMKDGFTTLARVEQLVSVMQKGKDNVINNIGDAARQWSTVAGVLAATESKDLLSHFIRLGGLQFLNQWLQEAQKFSNDSQKTSVEESIDTLLGALEKLPIDKKLRKNSGIRVTVERLIAQEDFKVQKKAKALFDCWSQDVDEDICTSDVVEKRGANSHEGSTDTKMEVSMDSAVCLEGSGGNKHCLNNQGSTDVSYVAVSKDVEPAGTSRASKVDTVALPKDREDERARIPVPDTSKEGSSNAEESSRCEVEAKASSWISSSSPPLSENDDNRPPDVFAPKDATNDKKQIIEGSICLQDNSSCRSTKKESCTASACIDSKGADSSIKSTSCADPGSERSLLENHLKLVQRDLVTTDDSNDGIELKTSHLGSPYSKSNDILRSGGNVKRQACESDLKGPISIDSILYSRNLKSQLDVEEVDGRKRRRSDMELDCVEDALEVARLVAKEVEREVVDYREPSCGSSGGNSEGATAQPCSSGSSSDKNGEIGSDHQSSAESPIRQDLSDDDDSSKTKRVKLFNGIDAEALVNDIESDQAAGALKESVGNADNNRCDFDLNEVVFTEEAECATVPVLDHPSSTLSAPIPVIATSKGVLDLPVARPQFEGELGWRGSAATSAFRPASPRRTMDGDKSTSSQGSKQRQNFLEIDLNVADIDEDPAADLGPVKRAPVSSGLPSGESSIEVSSRKEERLKLDLNRLGDLDEANPFQLSERRMEGKFFHPLHQNRNRSPSSASSSSSRYPSVRDFDLNDNPNLLDGLSQDSRRDLGKLLSQDHRTYGSLRLDEPLVSIMGSRLEIDGKDFVHKTQTLLPNGSGAEQAFSSNLIRVNGGSASSARPMLAYPPGPPPYGCNGLNMGPSMAFPQMYGATTAPYMLDSRGGTVIPQIMGSGHGVAQPFSRPPFLMSVTGPPPSGINGFDVTRSVLDLNSGMSTVDGENRDLGGLRHLFVQRHGPLVEEQAKPGTHHNAAGMFLKRKEPDCGRELNMVGYKQETSWHR